MKKQAKEGKVSDKLVLTILAIVLIAVVIVIIALNVNKDKTPVDSGNSGDVQEEVQEPTGPAIPGTENVSVNGNVKTNISDALKADKKYDIYTISDISLESVSGMSRLVATVSADVTEKVDGKPVTVKFYDKDGNLLDTMGAYIPQIKPGETKTLDASSTTDLANIYDFEIVDAE